MQGLAHVSGEAVGYFEQLIASSRSPRELIAVANFVRFESSSSSSSLSRICGADECPPAATSTDSIPTLAENSRASWKEAGHQANRCSHRTSRVGSSSSGGSALAVQGAAQDWRPLGQLEVVDPDQAPPLEDGVIWVRRECGLPDQWRPTSVHRPRSPRESSDHPRRTPAASAVMASTKSLNRCRKAASNASSSSVVSGAASIRCGCPMLL